MHALRLVVVDLPASGLDRHGVAHLIEEHRADVAVVHGAPSLLRWRSHCAALAREAGLVVVGGGRTAGGTLLLSSLGVDVEMVQVGQPLGRNPLGPGFAFASLRLLGVPFVLFGARLDEPGQWVPMHMALDVIGDRPPAVLAFSDRELRVEDGITVTDSHPITGGVRVDLRLGS